MKARRIMRLSHASRGLTLIELVVALGIFALVAIMGVQSLAVSLTLRDRLDTQASANDALGQGLALLRNDLSAALPLVFFPPGQARPASALRAIRPGQGFSLSLGGQPGIVAASGAVDAAPKQRVDWRFDPQAGQLTRQVWPTLYPARARQQGPEVPALEGITGLTLRSYWIGPGWVPGLRRPDGAAQSNPGGGSGDDDQGSGIAPEIYSGTLPRALEITLETRDFGQIVLLEYFQ